MLLLPPQNVINFQNCIFQIPGFLRNFFWTKKRLRRSKKLATRKCGNGEKVFCFYSRGETFIVLFGIVTCRLVEKLAKMVQMFYYENHGKCCKTLWKHDGKKLKVSQSMNDKKQGQFLNET